MKSSNANSLGKALEAVNTPVVCPNYETSDQHRRDLKTLGQLFQNPDQAAKLAVYYKGKADSITKTVSGLTNDKKSSTLVLYYSEKDSAVAFNVPPLGWMQTLQIQVARGMRIPECGSKCIWFD